MGAAAPGPHKPPLHVVKAYGNHVACSVLPTGAVTNDPPDQNRRRLTGSIQKHAEVNYSTSNAAYQQQRCRFEANAPTAPSGLPKATFQNSANCQFFLGK